MNLSYRPPQGDTTLFEKHLQDLLLRHDVYKKEVLITGGFNINLLDFENSKKVNKPARVTRYTATAIDHMFTNSFISTEIKSAIIKTDVSDNFPMLFVAKVNVDVNIKTEQHILKRNISDQSIKKLKQKLRDVTWNDIKTFDSVNHSYNRFLQIFLSLYNECFPKIKIKLKP